MKVSMASCIMDITLTPTQICAKSLHYQYTKLWAQTHLIGNASEFRELVQQVLHQSSHLQTQKAEQRPSLTILSHLKQRFLKAITAIYGFASNLHLLLTFKRVLSLQHYNEFLCWKKLNFALSGPPKQSRHFQNRIVVGDDTFSLKRLRREKKANRDPFKTQRSWLSPHHRFKSSPGFIAGLRFQRTNAHIIKSTSATPSVATAVNTCKNQN